MRMHNGAVMIFAIPRSVEEPSAKLKRTTYVMIQRRENHNSLLRYNFLIVEHPGDTFFTYILANDLRHVKSRYRQSWLR